MQAFSLTLQQLFIMFLYLAVGFVLYRTGIITKNGSKELAGLLIKLIIPAVVINSFCVQFSVQKLAAFGISALVGAGLLGLSMVICGLVFRTKPIENFAASFSNAGFMGLPLVSAILGGDAVFYIVGFTALLNILQWTYGEQLFNSEKKPLRLKTIFWNPIMGGVVIGLVLFVSGLGTKLPVVAKTALTGICGLNSPLAMMVLGVYFAQQAGLDLFTTPALYAVSLLRLAVVPLASLAVLWLLPIGTDMKLALLIVAAAPAGANTAVYAQIYGRDYTYASKIVVLSTLFSLVTIPLTVMLGSAVMG